VTIATSGGFTGGRTVVGVHRVAVVTGFRAVDSVVATVEGNAGTDGAVCSTDRTRRLTVCAGLGLGIAVVAFFLPRHDTVAAARVDAAAVAPVTVDSVAVVALFVRPSDSVSAGTKGAVAVTAIAFDGVAVVAGFALGHDPVATSGGQTADITSISIDLIAVIARFTRRHDPVATGADGTIAVAAVSLNRVGIVAGFLPAPHDTISADRIGTIHAGVGFIVVAVVTGLGGGIHLAIATSRCRTVIPTGVAIIEIPVVAGLVAIDLSVSAAAAHIIGTCTDTASASQIDGESGGGRCVAGDEDARRMHFVGAYRGSKVDTQSLGVPQSDGAREIGGNTPIEVGRHAIAESVHPIRGGGSTGAVVTATYETHIVDLEGPDTLTFDDDLHPLGRGVGGIVEGDGQFILTEHTLRRCADDQAGIEVQGRHGHDDVVAGVVRNGQSPDIGLRILYPPLDGEDDFAVR